MHPRPTDFTDELEYMAAMDQADAEFFGWDNDERRAEAQRDAEHEAYCAEQDAIQEAEFYQLERDAYATGEVTQDPRPLHGRGYDPDLHDPNWLPF